MSATATFIHNPFDLKDRDDAKICVQAYPTLEAVVGPLAEIGDRNVVSVNGKVVERQSWSGHWLQDDDHIVVRPRVEFGLFSALLGSILGALPAAGASLLGPITFGHVYGVGLSLAGGYLVRALSPTPKLPDFNIDRTSSQVYGVVSQTLQRAGVPIPLYFGRCKVQGNIISAYTYTDDNETRLGRAVVAFGEGPWSQFVDGSGKLDNQPIDRFSDVTYETKLGTYIQSASSLFDEVKPEYTFNAEVTYAESVTRDIPSSLGDDLEIGISFPYGLFWFNERGAADNHDVGVKISLRAVGAPSWHVLADESVVAATTSVYRKTYRASETYTGGSAFTYQRGTKYEVKLEKTTADHSGSRYGDDLYFELAREVFSDGFVYPGLANVALEGLDLSSLSGGLDVSFIADTQILPVWTGSEWVLQYSNNPAWIIYFLLTLPLIDGDGTPENPYRIAGYRGLLPSQVDLTSIYELAVYCDDLVPDGKGGTEKRIEIDRGFDVRTTIWEAIGEVCEVSRCCPVIVGDKVAVAINKPKTATQLFTVDNTNLSGFRRRWLPQEDRITEMELVFKNAEKDYADDPLCLLDEQAEASEYNKATVQLVGVTRESQAWREGKVRLNLNRLQKCVIELDVDVESLACTIGDVIKIQSRVPIWGQGLTVASGTASTVTLSSVPTVTGDDQVCVRTIDAVEEAEYIETFDVVSVDGATVTIDGTFEATPLAGNIAYFGPSKYVTKNFLIHNLSRQTNSEATIHAIDFYSDAFVDDVESPVLADPDYEPPTVDESPVIKPPTQGQIDAVKDLVTVLQSLNLNFPILSGDTWNDNTPAAGSIQWSSLTLSYKDQDYAIGSGSTVYPYVVWDINNANTTFQGKNDINDTVGAGKFIVRINNGGTNVAVVPMPVVAGALIAANAISADTVAVATLSAITAALGDITSGSITLSLGGATRLRLSSDGISFSNDAGEHWIDFVFNDSGVITVSADRLTAGTILAERIAQTSLGGIYVDRTTTVGTFIDITEAAPNGTATDWRNIGKAFAGDPDVYLQGAFKALNPDTYDLPIAGTVQVRLLKDSTPIQTWSRDIDMQTTGDVFLLPVSPSGDFVAGSQYQFQYKTSGGYGYEDFDIQLLIYYGFATYTPDPAGTFITGQLSDVDMDMAWTDIGTEFLGDPGVIYMGYLKAYSPTPLRLPMSGTIEVRLLADGVELQTWSRSIDFDDSADEAVLPVKVYNLNDYIYQFQVRTTGGYNTDELDLEFVIEYGFFQREGLAKT